MSPHRSPKRAGLPRSPIPVMGSHGKAARPAGKIDGVLNWIKSNSIVATVVATTGLLTPVVGFLQTGNVVPFALETLAIPDCYKYADTYYDKWSEFRREDKTTWREYPRSGGSFSFEFSELHRSRDAIELVNLTPRPEIPEWKTMVVSLPVCGGKARYAVGIPERWDDLFEVWTASN